MAAREAVVGQDVRPRDLRPGSLEEELHRPVEQQRAAARDGQEQRRAGAALDDQDDDRRGEQDRDHVDRPEQREEVHQRVHRGAGQGVEERRRERVHEEHLAVADPVGDRPEEEQADAKDPEAGDEQDRRGLPRPGDVVGRHGGRSRVGRPSRLRVGRHRRRRRAPARSGVTVGWARIVAVRLRGVGRLVGVGVAAAGQEHVDAEDAGSGEQRGQRVAGVVGVEGDPRQPDEQRVDDDGDREDRDQDPRRVRPGELDHDDAEDRQRLEDVTRRVAVDDARDVRVRALRPGPRDQLLHALAAGRHRDQHERRDDRLPAMALDEQDDDEADADDDQRDVGRLGDHPPDRPVAGPLAGLRQQRLVERPDEVVERQDRHRDEAGEAEDREERPGDGRRLDALGVRVAGRFRARSRARSGRRRSGGRRSARPWPAGRRSGSAGKFRRHGRHDAGRPGRTPLDRRDRALQARNNEPSISSGATPWAGADRSG